MSRRNPQNKTATTPASKPVLQTPQTKSQQGKVDPTPNSSRVSLSQRYGKANAGGSRDRSSQGAGQVLLGKGGLGFIARRGVDFGTSVAVQTLEGIARLATQQPLELLSLLPDLVPEVALALWNGTYLGCGPDSLRIKAMTVDADGGSEEAPEGTAAIKALWESQPDEVGGLIDALGQNYQMLAFSGMAAVEAVPGTRGQGVAAVYPVNTLTLRFKREDNGDLSIYQRQVANPNGLGLYSAGFGGMMVPMPMNRFYYSRMAALPDEPYGRAPFGAALTIVLECLAFMRDFLLAFHRIGMPRYTIGFDFEAWTKMAQDVVGLTDPQEIREYVQSAYAQAQTFFSDLNPDDAFFHDKGSSVQAVGNGNDWPDIPAIWNMLRLRLVQALKQLPTLMGIMDGGSETWSKIQFEIYAASLKSMVAKSAYPLVKASQLHLQLLGMPYVAEAEFREMRSITRLIDAQAEAQEILNEEAKVRNNWQTNITASQVATGSAPPSPEERAQDVPPKGAGMAPDGKGTTGLVDPEDENQPGEQQNQAEEDANNPSNQAKEQSARQRKKQVGK